MTQQILASAYKLGHTEACKKLVELAETERTSVLALCGVLGRIMIYEKKNFARVSEAISKAYEKAVADAEEKGEPAPPRPVYTKGQSGVLSVNQARKYAVVGAYFLEARREGASITDLDALSLINDLGIEALAMLARLADARAKLLDVDTLREYHSAIEHCVRDQKVLYADVVRYLREEHESVESAAARAATLKAARESKAKARQERIATATVRAQGAHIIDENASLEQIARIMLERAAWDVERAQKALLNAIAEYERAQAQAQAVSQAVETVAVAS